MWALSKIIRTHKQAEFTLKLINRRFFNLCHSNRAKNNFDETIVFPIWTHFHHKSTDYERLAQD